MTIRDVGRILYGDLEQTIILWQAGEHELALDAAFQPIFCGALAYGTPRGRRARREAGAPGAPAAQHV